MKSQLTTLKAAYEAPAVTRYDLDLEEVFCASGTSNDPFKVDDDSWFYDETEA